MSEGSGAIRHSRTDAEQEEWSRQQRVPPHPVDGHAEDTSALKNVPEIQEIIGTIGDFDVVARISADPRENLLESVVTKGPGHVRRALDRDAPGVLEVLNINP